MWCIDWYKSRFTSGCDDSVLYFGEFLPVLVLLFLRFIRSFISLTFCNAVVRLSTAVNVRGWCMFQYLSQ